MQICKNRKFLICGILFSLISFSGFSQPKPPTPPTAPGTGSGMPAMPTMPSVSMPSMPTMDSSFYTPEFPRNKNQNSNTSTSNTTNKDNQKKDDVKNTTTKQTVAPNITTSILNGNGLTAMDVSSLYDAGLFDDISSLATGNTNTSSYSTNILLQQILTSLEDLKQQQNTISDEERSSIKNSQKDSKSFKEREPAILRFKINGYIITDSLKTVFISSPEADGSFLLTADRVYYLNQQARTETIYLLFKATKHNGSTTIFTVVPTLMQDRENTNSFLYKMCLKGELEAQKTGNLVAIHINDTDFSMDMLLDIDK